MASFLNLLVRAPLKRRDSEKRPVVGAYFAVAFTTREPITHETPLWPILLVALLVAGAVWFFRTKRDNEP